MPPGLKTGLNQAHTSIFCAVNAECLPPKNDNTSLETLVGIWRGLDLFVLRSHAGEVFRCSWAIVDHPSLWGEVKSVMFWKMPRTSDKHGEDSHWKKNELIIYSTLFQWPKTSYFMGFFIWLGVVKHCGTTKKILHWDYLLSPDLWCISGRQGCLFHKGSHKWGLYITIRKEVQSVPSTMNRCLNYRWSQQAYKYPLVNSHSYGKSPCLLGISTISMVIFHSYFDITRG